MEPQTVDRIVFFIIGCGLGTVLGYFASYVRCIRKEVHDVLELERKRDESGILQHRVAFNVSFALLMIFVFYAAYSSFQNSRDLKQNAADDFARVCVAAEDIRQVQRSTVDAVYTLAISIVRNDKDRPPKLTDQQKAEVNLFIDRANAFREDAYANIQPTEECEPYVHDKNVDPPTPPYPNIP